MSLVVCSVWVWADPKSIRTISLWGVMSMLSGEMSRWMIPVLWMVVRVFPISSV